MLDYDYWRSTPLDGNYDADQGAALHQVNLALPPADHFPVPAPHPPRQQELSRALDRVVIAQLAAPGPGREAYRAHFQLLQQEGRGLAPRFSKRCPGPPCGHSPLPNHGPLAASLAYCRF